MGDHILGDGSPHPKVEADDAPIRGSVDSDIGLEEAQMLLREEFDFEDSDLAKPRRTPQRAPGCFGFLNGPQPARPQKIQPLFPTLQEAPAKLLNKLLARREHQSLFLNIILVIWLFLFVGFLTTELPSSDADGNFVINLDCTDSLWKRKNGCGIDGINCHPFDNSSFAFRCPSNCAGVQLLNPHAVGAYDANYRPLVVGSETYRGDSFVCAAALHAGIIEDRSGGCGRVELVGEKHNFTATKSHGIESIPFDSDFPLSFKFGQEKLDFKCSSEPRSILLSVSLMTTAILSVFSTQSKIFFPIFVLIFAHVGFVSDPPQASYRNITVLPDHLSMFAKRLLPAFFVAVLIWKTVVRRTLSGLDAPVEKTILWLGNFWVGALSNYTLDWIPISRLTAHDLNQQPGAKLALAIIIGVLVLIALSQVYYFWCEGRLLKYLGLYGLFVFAILICLAIPGVNLRIHHYIIGLLLLPGTSMQTRPSLLYQGILLGLFVNGIARWDFDSILQTTAALREDGRFNSIVPAVIMPKIESSATEGLVAAFPWMVLPGNIQGISVLVNDVERYRGFIDEYPNGGTFRWERPANDAMNDYFRFAFIKDGLTLDYSRAGVLSANGVKDCGLRPLEEARANDSATRHQAGAGKSGSRAPQEAPFKLQRDTLSQPKTNNVIQIVLSENIITSRPPMSAAHIVKDVASSCEQDYPRKRAADGAELKHSQKRPRPEQLRLQIDAKTEGHDGPNFLQLHPEIRNQIYEYAAEDTHRCFPILHKRPKKTVRQGDSLEPPIPDRKPIPYIGLTQACLQIRAEFRPMWLSTHRVPLNLTESYLKAFFLARVPKITRYNIFGLRNSSLRIWVRKAELGNNWHACEVTRLFKFKARFPGCVITCEAMPPTKKLTLRKLERLINHDNRTWRKSVIAGRISQIRLFLQLDEETPGMVIVVKVRYAEPWMKETSRTPSSDVMKRFLGQFDLHLCADLDAHVRVDYL